MKLCIVIPAWNEEQALPRVLADVPKRIAGIDEIQTIVVDDGSTDGTCAVAVRSGANTVVRLKDHSGLASAFRHGMDTALACGADIVVNIDADFQYLPSEIPLLVAPILEGKADIVVGDRQTDKVKEFSRTKRLLQRIGSEVVRRLARMEGKIDAVSGFRAFSAEALLRINVVTDFSYTTETIIQAREKGLAVVFVPITRMHTTRPSRLFSGNWEHVRKSGVTILRVYLMYQPLRVLSLFSLATGAIGIALLLRLVVIGLTSPTGFYGHMQSLTLGIALCGLALLLMVLAIVSDLIAINRRLLEDALERVKRLEREGKLSGRSRIDPASIGNRSTRIDERPHESTALRDAEGLPEEADSLTSV